MLSHFIDSLARAHSPQCFSYSHSFSEFLSFSLTSQNSRSLSAISNIFLCACVCELCCGVAAAAALATTTINKHRLLLYLEFVEKIKRTEYSVCIWTSCCFSVNLQTVEARFTNISYVETSVFEIAFNYSQWNLMRKIELDKKLIENICVWDRIRLNVHSCGFNLANNSIDFPIYTIEVQIFWMNCSCVT